jgi:hypothetical protein
MNEFFHDDEKLQELVRLATDYSSTTHHFLLVLGECNELPLSVISQFTDEYQTLPNTVQHRRHAVSLNAPSQIIPEIVKALALRNVAVYQVVLLSE